MCNATIIHQIQDKIHAHVHVATLYSMHGIINYLYSTGHRQHQNETCLNTFGGQTQIHLRSPRPSNAGNS